MKKRILSIALIVTLIISNFCILSSANADNGNTSETYTIPYGVTTLTYGMITNPNLKELTIPETVTSIGIQFFYGLNSLEKVYMLTKHPLNAEIGVNDLTGGYDFTVYGYENAYEWVKEMNHPFINNSMGLGAYMPQSNYINYVPLSSETINDEKEAMKNNSDYTGNAGSSSSTPQQKAVSVVVNSEYVSFDVPPQIINDRVMVPVRAIFETLGATVEWFPDEQRVLAEKWYEPTKGYVFAQFIIGSNIMGNSFGEMYDYIDTPAMIVDGRTLVPARAAAEAFNCNVKWDAESRTVYIYE